MLSPSFLQLLIFQIASKGKHALFLSFNQGYIKSVWLWSSSSNWCHHNTRFPNKCKAQRYFMIFLQPILDASSLCIGIPTLVHNELECFFWDLQEHFFHIYKLIIQYWKSLNSLAPNPQLHIQSSIPYLHPSPLFLILTIMILQVNPSFEMHIRMNFYPRRDWIFIVFRLSVQQDSLVSKHYIKSSVYVMFPNHNFYSMVFISEED